MKPAEFVVYWLQDSQQHSFKCCWPVSSAESLRRRIERLEYRSLNLLTHFPNRPPSIILFFLEHSASNSARGTRIDLEILWYASGTALFLRYAPGTGLLSRTILDLVNGESYDFRRSGSPVEPGSTVHRTQYDARTQRTVWTARPGSLEEV